MKNDLKFNLLRICNTIRKSHKIKYNKIKEQNFKKK